MSTSAPRQRLSLDGVWQFHTDPHGNYSAADLHSWRSMRVPAPWQSQSDDLRFYQGVAWYTRRFELPTDWADSALILHFGAVDYHAEIWLNGQRLGDHEGGYLPFEFDISQAAQTGSENEILVRVSDPDNSAHWQTPFSEIPHGKQSWYGPLSGLWQSVWLEARPRVHISTLKVTPHAASATVHVETTLNSAASQSTSATITLLAPDGSQAATQNVSVQGQQLQADFTLDQIVRWDIDNPARYTVIVQLNGQGSQDQLSTRFGFRSFESRDGILWLNDRPLMLRGALDQDYYPDLIATPPSYEFLLHQARLAKRMGLNCLRCHIKVADPRYLEAADEVGLLVWAELPNWMHWTPEVGERGVATLQAAIQRDWNHPSVVIWTIINESWGLDQSIPEQRAWLRAAYEQIKPMAGDRLIVDNSACFNNVHIKSDLDDYHFYAAMPDERKRWEEWVRQFAARPKWSYASELPTLKAGQERWPLGDKGYGAVLPEVERTGQEPLLVSEFGNWGLPSLASLHSATNADPWWFETGDDWGDGVVYPHGVEQRFKRLGLEQIFGDYERFAAATRRSEFDALQFEIEAMRRHASIGGYIITEFTDVHWECNGMLDMQRTPKMPMDALVSLNSDTILIVDRSQGAWRVGEQRNISVSLSHWGASTLEHAELRWQIEGQNISGQQTIATAIPTRSTTPLGELGISAPAQAGLYRVQLALFLGEKRVAASSLRMAVYPALAKPALPVRSYGTDSLHDALTRRGFAISEQADITIADRFDAALRERVSQGEHVVLLASSPEAVSAAMGGLHLVPRAGTAWQGSWASSFCWMAGDWPGDGILDDSFLGIMPNHIINGVPQRAFPSSVSAGLCVGWIQKPVALIARQRIGRGSVTVTSFRLTERLGVDPVADMVLDTMLQG